MSFRLKFAGKFTLIFLFVFVTNQSFSQNFKQWKFFANGYGINFIAGSKELLWAKFQGGIFSYDVTTGEKTEYNSINSGIQAQFISCACYDNNGSFYFATESGIIYKYKNNSWSKFTISLPGLTQSRISVIYIDNRGYLWIGNDSGVIGLYDWNSWKIFNYKTTGLSYGIKSIMQDKRGILWFASRDELLVTYDDVNWQTISIGEYSVKTRISAMCIDSADNKWVIDSFNDLWKYDNQKWTLVSTKIINSNSKNIACMSVDRYDNIWFGASNYGVIKYDKSSVKIYISSSSGKRNDDAFSILFDKNGHLWTTSNSHFFEKFDGSNWNSYEISKYHANNLYPKLAIDFGGNKWIATSNDGLYKFDNVDWVSYNKDNSNIPSNRISAIAFDKFGNKWIGTYEGYITKFDGSKWTVYDNLKKGYNFINAISCDSKGNLWIVLYNNIYEFDGNNWIEHPIQFNGKAVNGFSCIAIDNRDNKWVGTNNNKLIKISNNSFEIFDSPDYIENIIINNKSEIISISGNIFARYNGNKWTILSSYNSNFPNGKITSVAREKDSVYWIGTTRGLARFDGIFCQKLDESNSPLDAVEISQMQVDNYGNKWMLISDNLICFNEDGIVNKRNYSSGYFKLSQNYPNPFNPVTNIDFYLEKTEKVKITVYNILGEEISTLLNEVKSEGIHTVSFNASSISSGVYFYTLQSGDFRETKKMVLVR